MADHVRVIKFSNAEALLTALRFVSVSEETMPWQTATDARRWMFRGVGDAQYRLVPSATRGDTWRPKSTDGVKPSTWIRADKEMGWTQLDQIRAEHALVWRFFRMIDTQGLRLPDGSPALGKSLKDGRFIDPKRAPRWPSRKLWSLVALAQHYLVPTRMLDWSRKPLIAAYFAASDCAAKLDDDKAVEDLAVWALDRAFVQSDRAPALHLVAAPRAGNPNLHLQSGLFTLLRPELDPGAPLDPNDFDLRAYCERNATGSTVLHKLTLPASEAGRLLTLLRDEFIQGTTVYAGYEGAARSVKEHRLRRPR